jgi:hypothetical protein
MSDAYTEAALLTQQPMANQSYLVQRLKRPTKSTVLGPDNPFAFGGGLRNGGLSGDAMALLRGIFSFDYMGAAEFEWGAIPEALSGLAKDADRLVGFGMGIPLASVPANWRAPKNAPAPEGDGHVWVICRHEHQAEAVRRVEAFARGEARAKERVGLDAALRPYSEWDGEVIGWLELDNGWFFFTSEAAWLSTCELFGVETWKQSTARSPQPHADPLPSEVSP